MAKKNKKNVEKIDTAKLSEVFKKDKISTSIDDLKKNLNMGTSEEDSDELSYLKNKLDIEESKEESSYLDKLKADLKNVFKKEKQSVVEEEGKKIEVVEAVIEEIVVPIPIPNEEKLVEMVEKKEPKSKKKSIKTKAKANPKSKTEVVKKATKPKKVKKKKKKEEKLIDEPKVVVETKPMAMVVKPKTKKVKKKKNESIEGFKKEELGDVLLTSKKVVVDKPLNAVKQIDSENIKIIKDVASKPMSMVVKEIVIPKIDEKKNINRVPVEFHQEFQKDAKKRETRNYNGKVFIDKTLTNYEIYKNITSIPFKIKFKNHVIFDSLININTNVHFRLNAVAVYGTNYPYTGVRLINHK